MRAAAADRFGLDGRFRWLSSFKVLMRDAWKADTLQLLRLLLIASILVPALLLAAAAWQSYWQTLKEAEMEVRKTVSILHEHARKVFETHELLIARVDDHIQGLRWDAIGRSESLHRYLSVITAGLPQVDSIWLADPNGLVRNRSHLSPAPDILVADEDYFATQRTGNVGTYVSRSRHDRTTDTLNVTRRRTTADGTFDGTVTVAVSLEYFRRFYTDITPSRDHVAGLIRMDGEILVRNPAPTAVQRLPDRSGFRQAIKLADEGIFTAPSAIDGVARISGYSKLADYPVYVVFGLDKNAVLGEWHQDLLAYGTIAVPAAAGLFLLTWFALRKTTAHRLAMQRWQQERELCGLLVNSSSDGILAYDDRLRCTLWNPAMEAIYGIPGEQMRGKDLRHVLSSVRGTLIEPVIRNAIAGVRGDGPGDAAKPRFRPTDADADAENSLETRSGPLRDWDGKVIGGLCFVRDRTEQHRLEEELRRAEAAEARREAEREAEQRLADIAANFPGHIYRRVLHRDDRVSHPYLGHAVDAILNLEPSDAGEPLPIEEFARRHIHPNDASRWREAVLVSARTLSPYRLEFRVLDPHGDVRWLRSDARAYRGEDGTVIWDGVAIDLTDLKETEEALRESDERMSLAAEAAELGPWSWDIARRRVRWSDRCKAILGVPPEAESSCERLLSAVHPDDRDRVHETVRSALDERRGYETEFRVIWPDGSQRWVLDKGSALYDVNEVPVRMSGVIVDITARKLAELERQQKDSIDHG